MRSLTSVVIKVLFNLFKILTTKNGKSGEVKKYAKLIMLRYKEEINLLTTSKSHQ